MVDIDVSVLTRGPVFDGRAPAAVRAYLADATQQVAQQAFADVHHELDRVIREPTPYYETQILNDRVSGERWRIHDRGISYGPWLEGTSSRNRTTRFKGYATFRRICQAFNQGKARTIAERVLARHIGRLQ